MNFRNALWGSLVVFNLHNLEESISMAGFFADHGNQVPSFAMRFAHPLVGETFWVVVAIITLLGAAMVGAAVKGGAMSRGMFIGMIWIMGGIVVNGFHHLLLSLFFLSYTPGVITSAFLLLPYGVLILWKALRDELIGRTQLIWSFVVGALTMGPVILVAKAIAERILGLL
jgi:hypothetical protein